MRELTHPNPNPNSKPFTTPGLARVFRVLRLARRMSGVTVFTSALSRSVPQLSAIFFFLVLTIIITSCAIFYTEETWWRGLPPRSCPSGQADDRGAHRSWGVRRGQGLDTFSKETGQGH